MTASGYKTIEIAKENGSWNIIDEVDNLIIPNDLEEAFRTNSSAKDFFLSLSKSNKKMILHWLLFAKREETRQKRIAEIIESALQRLKPKHIR